MKCLPVTADIAGHWAAGFSHTETALMAARREVGVALKQGEKNSLMTTHAAVDAAKHGLGEGGPVWWKDSASDYGRHHAKNTPYADWYAALIASSGTAREVGAAKAASEPEQNHDR